MDQPNVIAVRYCLYARKSSEQDERQALSIDAQVKEAREMAEKCGLEVVAERHESHSAKASGQRPEYMQMLEDIRNGTYNGILTWAPDRLSRNAGDLGALVDLMDQGLLAEIRTPSQRFINSPNEKFLLMILCSQAKLENDNKSVNVKRGLRAKVEMGYRPNMAPLGYLHDKYAPKGERRVFLDPKRAPVIKEAFEKIANEGWTGRQLKHWFDESGFTTRAGKQMTLSMIYRMVDNPFYTGRFEFPRGSGKWFAGKHETIVDQKTFDRAVETMKCAPKGPRLQKEYAFTRLIKCGECGSTVCAEEKLKRLKDGTVRRYVYYGCGKRWMTGCKQTYIREEELIGQLCEMIKKVDIDKLSTLKRVKDEMGRVQRLIAVVGGKTAAAQFAGALQGVDVHDFAAYVLREGMRDEKRDLLDKLKSNFVLKDKRIYLAP